MGRTASGAGEGLALNLIQRVCVGDILTRTAQRYPDKVAIADLDGGVSLTYAELNHHANRVARSLLGLGLRHQDMVAIMSRNTWQFVVTYFACAKEPVSRTQVFPQDCSPGRLSESIGWNSPSPEVFLWPTTSAR
ncbi:hypothetical protein E1B22_00210 [Thermaerobacter sp. FW80]|uniref:AMP-binding protein n=1 Tax=Thermaerobacter sp. FW80 TaxID=2546351 RepID=UPI0010756020|nr:AMP-binding protein [Thermaerobacter sp. FW80]QBS36572.1 hypothetical protein E1B22_00210 [Thermaerobacter sp. FW80]